jgi:phosphate transport system protein
MLARLSWSDCHGAGALAFRSPDLNPAQNPASRRMSVQLRKEVDRLRSVLLSVCALVEEQVQNAVRAVLERDTTLAETVKRRDVEIDRREIEVEEECLKALALHQPVAGDLRLIVAALKINSDLERIGDLAVNMARKAKAIAAAPPVEVSFDLGLMCTTTCGMLHDSIEALIHPDIQRANSICVRDSEVDQMKRDIRVEIEHRLRTQPGDIRQLLGLLAVSRNLERVADLATNIAEDVCYLVEGRIIRHCQRSTEPRG